MKKRIISAVLALILVAAVSPIAALAAGGLSNFVRVNTYQSGHFSDVPTSKWYTPYVQACYEYDLVNGITTTTFAPDKTMTIAEAVKLAVSLHNIYYTGDDGNIENGEPWYTPYTTAALQIGIISEDYPNYDAEVTRSEFAVILAAALPAEALAVRNSVADNAIPDVPLGYTYSDAVYELYRAGVLIGSDALGTFFPNDTIKRGEASAIIVRMANAAYRKSITLQRTLTPEQVFEMNNPAVFYIAIYDSMGTPIKTGSGFFINSNGLAVTNYHVIRGAASAVIIDYNENEYDVSGVYDYDEDLDLALLQIDGDDFATLERGDSDSIVTGAKVYAIGSPLGFKNTISPGIISSASRLIDGLAYIQTTAAISPGSSGGALIDAAGKVIGVTTATAVAGQNINIAVPINQLDKLTVDQFVTLASILPDTVYYTDHYPTPDFGAFTHTPRYKKEIDANVTSYYYKTSSLNMSVEVAVGDYIDLLEQYNFAEYGYSIEDGNVITYYSNGTYSLLVTFGLATVDRTECLRIQIIDLAL